MKDKLSKDPADAVNFMDLMFEEENSLEQEEPKKKDEFKVDEDKPLPEDKQKKKPKDKKEDVEEEEEEKKEDKDKGKKTKKETIEDIEEDLKKKETEKKHDKKDDDESELIVPFVDLLDERFDWGLKDDEKPKTIDEFVDFIDTVITENSKPSYYDPIVEQFDNYMKRGGDPRKFIEVNYMVPEYDKMDVKNVNNQKRIVKDYYTIRGIKEEKIEKMIERFVENNELEDEATDAQKELTELTMKQKEILVKEQEKKEEDRKRDAIRFFDETKRFLGDKKDLYGIPIGKNDKEELLEYIFLKDKTGMTEQQRAFSENPIEYILVSNFLYKHREDLLKSINNKATTSAADRLKEKLRGMKEQQRHKMDRSSENATDEDWVTTFTHDVV
jgi:hypothetical protein